MDNMDTNIPEEQTVPPEEEELGHSDKIVGVLTEPNKVFKSIASHEIKTMDWFLPVIIYAIIALIGFTIMMSNSEVSLNFEIKASAKIEQQIKKQIESGKLTQEQAEKGKEIGLKWAKIVTYLVKFFGPLFILFVISLIYWLIIKYGFKTDASYKGILVAVGLPFYILIIQSIVTVILAYILGIYINGPNLAEILGMDISKFPAVLLSFVDIFMIWYFIAVSIGLAKIFHSDSTIKYYILTFGLWIGLTILFVVI